MGPANPWRAPVRVVGRHEGLHVRQGKRGSRILRCVATGAWKALGILELICAVGLIVPAALHWQPMLTVVAAAILAMESLIFVWVHIKYRESTPIILSAVLGLLMAFIVYGRMLLKPIF